jgi:hypothetical protein
MPKIKIRLKLEERLIRVIGLAVMLGAAPTGRAELKTWTGSAGDSLWTTAGSWSPSGVPAPGDNVTFTNLGFTDNSLELGGVANIVLDANLPSIINSLGFRNKEGFHNVNLTSPLVVTGTSSSDVAFVADDGQPAAMFVGSGIQDGAADVVYTSFMGESLTVSNRYANLSVMQGSTTSGAHWATLDLSALNSFTCIVSNVLVAHDFGEPVMRPNGTLILAVNNTITANMISLSDAYQNAGSGGAGSRIFLGGANTLNVDRIRIAMHKCVGTLSFREGLTTPSAVFRNAAGTGRQVSWEIGDEYEPDTTIGYYTSGQAIGTMDLTSGTIDAMVDRITLGRGQTNNPTRTGDGNGTLTLTGGTIDVNTLEMGIQLTGGASAGRGILNVSIYDASTPSIVKVNSNIVMAVQLEGNTEPTGSTAVINLDGGRVEVGGDVIDGGGFSTINISNRGQLDLMPAGDASAGNVTVDILNLADGSITNYATLAVSNIVVTGGTTLFTVYPAQTLAPLAVGKIGTLAVDGEVSLRGTLDMDISKNGAERAADQISATGPVNVGGTLKVRFSGDSALAAGDKFTLFTSLPASGSFATLSLPSPGAGLAWTNKISTDGSIEVIVSNDPAPSPAITVTREPGGIVLSWPVGYAGFSLLGQTNNAGVGLGSNWSPVPGLAGNQITIQVDPTKGSVFFRLFKP